MKLKISKKKLKNLSEDMSKLPMGQTPNVQGGTGSWPSPATTTMPERNCTSGFACATLPHALMCQPDYSKRC
ncbi:hypothetical protein BGP78_20150 [Pseudoalteromonas sp. MSK9-3]|uniref:hypothetical protein n=1 Tax=Pseudoalteromonas sp. MSK9-3 TaxID=1897633 RepID=UPI000E6CEAB3|nr:hypothetical protein [Pseudoalteromonas sp. MSK9-3]RJE72322.1 hypothetical protein BGP78_20150 [Pseudoalteromonas sp. MSK9-3]